MSSQRLKAGEDKTNQTYQCYHIMHWHTHNVKAYSVNLIISSMRLTIMIVHVNESFHVWNPHQLLRHTFLHKKLLFHHSMLVS